MSTEPKIEFLGAISEILLDAIILSRCDLNALPVFVKCTKAVEEAGELAEAVLQNHGYVAADKPGVGTVMEEAADSFLQVIDILQIEYPTMEPSLVLANLEDMLKQKLGKWIAKKMAFHHSHILTTITDQYPYKDQP